MTVLPAQTANMLVRAQKPHLEIRMVLPTDQKVGGSSPSERARHLRRSGTPTGLIDPFNWPRWCCPDRHADSHRGDAPCQQPGGTSGCPAGRMVEDAACVPAHRYPLDRSSSGSDGRRVWVGVDERLAFRCPWNASPASSPRLIHPLVNCGRPSRVLHRQGTLLRPCVS